MSLPKSSNMRLLHAHVQTRSLEAHRGHMHLYPHNQIESGTMCIWQHHAVWSCKANSQSRSCQTHCVKYQTWSGAPSQPTRHSMILLFKPEVLSNSVMDHALVHITKLCLAPIHNLLIMKMGPTWQSYYPPCVSILIPSLDSGVHVQLSSEAHSEPLTEHGLLRMIEDLGQTPGALRAPILRCHPSCLCC
jgi:hypothetical protein